MTLSEILASVEAEPKHFRLKGQLADLLRVLIAEREAKQTIRLDSRFDGKPRTGAELAAKISREMGREFATGGYLPDTYPVNPAYIALTADRDAWRRDAESLRNEAASLRHRAEVAESERGKAEAQCDEWHMSYDRACQRADTAEAAIERVTTVLHEWGEFTQHFQTVRALDEVSRALIGPQDAQKRPQEASGEGSACLRTFDDSAGADGACGCFGCRRSK